jgi:hypothetical protein
MILLKMSNIGSPPAEPGDYLIASKSGKSCISGNDNVGGRHGLEPGGTFPLRLLHDRVEMESGTHFAAQSDWAAQCDNLSASMTLLQSLLISNLKDFFQITSIFLRCKNFHSGILFAFHPSVSPTPFRIDKEVDTGGAISTEGCGNKRNLT